MVCVRLLGFGFDFELLVVTICFYFSVCLIVIHGLVVACWVITLILRLLVLGDFYYLVVLGLC